MQASIPHFSELPNHNEVCPRCGTFAGLKPFWGRRLCAPCVGREATALRGGGVSVGGLLSGIASLPRRVWLISVALHSAAGIPTVLRTLAGDDSMRALSFEIMADAIASAVVTYIGVQAMLGRESKFAMAWRAFGQRAVHWLGASFLAGLWIIAFSLLLVVPGIVKSLSFALVTPIVLFESLSRAREVLDKSSERMRGARLAALVAYGLFFTLELLVSVIPSVLVAEFAVPGAQFIEAATGMLSVVLGSPITLITVVLYVRLTPPDVAPVAQEEAAAAVAS